MKTKERERERRRDREYRTRHLIKQTNGGDVVRHRVQEMRGKLGASATA